jgi:hypothetical protein
MKAFWSTGLVRQWPMVRFWYWLMQPMRRLPALRPKPLNIPLGELAPIWLRHNEDFRPAAALRDDIIVSPMSEAPASHTVVTEVAREMPPCPVPAERQSTPAMPVATRVPNEKSVAPPRSSLFVRECVWPYRPMLEAQQALKPVLAIIEVLEKYGDCPSVVLEQKSEDEEARDLYSIRDTLGQVTLRDHTYRVTKWGLEYLQRTYKDHEPLIPKMLVACLGHDLGKIPAFRASGIYSMRDHPSVSVVKLREMFQGHDVVWVDEVCQVILSHHRRSTDQFATLLKQADARAREEEVASASKELKIHTWAEWFQVEEFISALQPQINVLRRNKWVAMGVGGLVYCQAEGAFAIIKDLAQAKKIVDIHLLRASDRDQVLIQLVDSLRGAGMLGGDIGEGFYGRRYQIRMRSNKQWNNYLIPLLESVFKMLPSELEARKTGVLTQIIEVRAQ